MKRYILFFISFLLSPVLFASDLITLKNADDIKDAVELNQAIDIISNKVMDCVSKQLAPPNKCFCLYPKENKAFIRKATAIISKHSEWEGKVIFWQLGNDPTGYGYNISIPGIKKQMEMNCE